MRALVCPCFSAIVMFAIVCHSSSSTHVMFYDAFRFIAAAGDHDHEATYPLACRSEIGKRMVVLGQAARLGLQSRYAVMLRVFVFLRSGIQRLALAMALAMEFAVSRIPVQR